MFDLKQSGAFAAVAFVISFLIGLISRSNMPLLIIRPLIFAVIFFALSAIIKILISKFLPELLGDGAQDDGFKPGSRINILEEDTPSDMSSLAEGFISGALGQASGAKPDDSESDLGDISDLSRRITLPPTDDGALSGIDQNEKEQYTDMGGSSDSIEPDFSNMFGTGATAGSQEKAAGTGASVGASTKAAAGAKSGAKRGGGSNSDEDLPDLDSMEKAFMTESSDQGSEASEYSGPITLKKSSDKTPKWTEDFDAKEIAMGIRSVLKKDKEG